MSLFHVLKNADSTIASDYLEYLDVNLKNSEKEVFIDLINKIGERSLENYGGFYVGFQIEQISNEFDILRIGYNYNINIELKYQASEEVIIKQLKKNKHYLTSLGNPSYYYTYVKSTDTIYTYKESTLEQITPEELIDVLNRQELVEDLDIHKLFKPTDYLVSPFNSTKKFISNEYFLSNHQEQIKSSFFKDIEKIEKPIFYAIKGDAGTGKTLLTYDIAKELKKKFNVLMIFCAYLNRGHRKLKTNSWSIVSIAEFDSFVEKIPDYDFIFIDEAQRIYTEQLYILTSLAMEHNIPLIFSYDPKQCFSDYEFNRNIPLKIEQELEEKVFTLSKKVRTNNELSSFVSNLFDLSKINRNYKYENIEILFFSTNREAKSTIDYYQKKDYEIINYTPSRYNDNIHDNIGQEFDLILGVIDNNFYYDTYNLLTSNNVKGSPGYDLDKMLYQILTRARKKITLVIINNNHVFKECMKILNRNTVSQ